MPAVLTATLVSLKDNYVLWRRGESNPLRQRVQSATATLAVVPIETSQSTHRMRVKALVTEPRGLVSRHQSVDPSRLRRHVVPKRYVGWSPYEIYVVRPKLTALGYKAVREPRTD